MAKDRRFGPVGRCIYCRKSDVHLTAEHPMPSNIGGDIVLLKATCDECKQRIDKFEAPVLGWWTPIRFVRNMGGRRKEKRKKTLHLKVRLRPDWTKIVPVKTLRGPIGNWKFEQVPYEEHPAPTVLYAFKGPGLIRGLTPEESAKDFLAEWSWQHLERVKTNPRFSEIKHGTFFYPIPFARLIAKIAHGIAVLRYGIDGFEPFLTDIIRGDDLSKLWYYVGGDHTKPPPVPQRISVALWGPEPEKIASGEPHYILADVRLFANLGAPVYLAVVGKNPKDGGGLVPYGLPNREHIKALLGSA